MRKSNSFYSESSTENPATGGCPSHEMIRITGNAIGNIHEILNFLMDMMRKERLVTVIDDCASFSGLNGDKTNPETLMNHFHATILKENDPDGYRIKTTQLARLFDTDIMRLPTKAFLLAVAERYLERLEYLCPLMHNYACAINDLSLQTNSSAVFLFLGDALTFFPSLWALRGPQGPLLHMVLYTRSFSDMDLKPAFLLEDSNRDQWTQGLTELTGGLLVDVGLYGTLLEKLGRTGYIRQDAVPYFFVSQNPLIPGYLNQLGELTASGDPYFSQETRVLYADTIETLLKPFLIRLENGQPQIIVELSDMISLTCSAAFLWRLKTISMQTIHRCDDLTKAMLPVLPPTDHDWFIPMPIPAWSFAEEFLKNNRITGLVPRDTVDLWFKKRSEEIK